jgi:tetratricopeptide (TPR) repeat protein
MRAFAPCCVLLASLALTPAAPAAIESTVDEWVNRFLPEETPKIDLPNYAGPLDRAAAEVRAGKFRATLATLHAAKDASPSTKFLRAQALAGLGETDDALKLLADPALAKDAAALAYTASLLLDYERTDEAAKAVEAFLAAYPDAVAAHYYKGQLLEQRGEFPEAIATYKWAIEGQQSFLQKWEADPSQFQDAEELSLIAAMIDRWATLSGAYKELQELNNTVLAMFVRAFDVIDRQHIPARLRAAEFAIRHGDKGRATEYLKPALAQAPRNPAVLAMASADDKGALGTAASLRDSDPNSFNAGIAEVMGFLNTQQPVQAADRAAVLFGQHPKRLQAIGLWAATQYLTGNERAIDELPKLADAVAPKRNDAQATAAEVLASRSQRDAAEKLYRVAMAKTPWETTLYHGLGDIYLNDSRDDKAREVLNQANALDPYNITTLNYIRLLDGLKKYTRLDTKHYEFYSDTNADPIAAEEMAPFLENAIEDLSKIFDYTPTEKMVVQIFPTDDEFSVRLAGIPGVENFGVSFGRALASIAPRKGTKQGNFNWARVLRHELVHTVNLLQTKNRCPRWLTEGLAVWQEGVPFRFANVPPELYKRAMADDLFTIRGLQMAFIAPKRGSDGEQAYTQGAWLARYMDATYGRQSIVKLLNAYGASKTDADAFREATGQELPAFEKAWHAWMKEQFRPWGYDKKTTETVKILLEEGEALIKKRFFAEALPKFEEATRLQPTEPRPHQRLAYLYLQKEIADADKVIEHLKFLHVLELQNNRLAKQIARLYLKQEKLDDALHWANESTYVDLYDAAAYELRAEIFDRMNRPEDAAKARNTAARVKLWEETRDKPTEPGDPGN